MAIRKRDARRMTWVPAVAFGVAFSIARYQGVPTLTSAVAGFGISMLTLGIYPMALRHWNHDRNRYS